MSQTERDYFDSANEGLNPVVAKIELDNGIAFSVNEASLPLRIGRDRTCDLYFPSGHVSRQHCELDQLNGILFLKDMSSNGTSVGHRTIKQESVSIQGPTPILLAGEARITITPSRSVTSITVVREERRESAERRDNERRQSDRRLKNVVVDFERRRDQTRRVQERRIVARR